ncbi:MAG: signal peptidase I [Rhodospirillales bacterium]
MAGGSYFPDRISGICLAIHELAAPTFVFWTRDFFRRTFSFFAIWIYAAVDAFIGARRIGAARLHRYNRWYVYLLIILAGAFPYNGAVNDLPIAAFSMSAGSMMPTLLAGDYVWADKSAYSERPPNRGDVAIFKLPTDNKTDFIKRVIGLLGDQVQMKNGRLYINGGMVKREKTSDFVRVAVGGSQTRTARFMETLPGGRSYAILELTDNGPLDNTELFTVPAGHFFALGDHRDNSMDSRILTDFGFIPFKNFVARAEILYFSSTGSARWWQIWRWPAAIRAGRIGKQIN